MHLHTEYTDGEPSVEQVIRRAESLGLVEIAFTEHARADSDWFPEFAAKVRARGKGSRVNVLVGAEVRITDFEGSLDISDEIRREADLVLASVHRFPGKDGTPVPFSQVPREAFAETEYRLALGLLRRGGAHVLAHPGGMSLRTLGAFPATHLRSLMLEAKEKGVAIEINSAYLPDLGAFSALLRETDPMVSLGSDAHRLEEVGRCRELLKDELWARG
jgi:putative hydrolase